jgi:hypothetical protein
VKNTTVKIIAAAMVSCSLLAWVFYDQYINAGLLNNQEKTHEHGVGVMPLSCSDEEMGRLEFRINNVKIWTKKHQDLLNMDSAIPSLDRRFKGTNVIPIIALINEHKNIKSLEVIPCDAESLQLSLAEVTDQPDEYVLGLSRGDRMKLLRPAQQRYKTVLRNVKAINLNR